ALGTARILDCGAVRPVAAIQSAPWRSLANADYALGACGVAGVVYALIVTRRARRTTVYKPVLEDWLWHSVFPFVAYAALLGAAIELRHDPATTLFVIAAAALFLLFIGIHNASHT